jgi:hypothetical protein
MIVRGVPDTAGHLPGVRTIEFKDRYVVVDGYTESISSYKPCKPIVKPTGDCGGTAEARFLGHPTQLVYREMKGAAGVQRQTTAWVAVDLNCIEVRQQEVHLVASGMQVDREAISITVGDRPQEYFDVPSNYQERGPRRRRSGG